MSTDNARLAHDIQYLLARAIADGQETRDHHDELLAADKELDAWLSTLRIPDAVLARCMAALAYRGEVKS